uniref:Uncharacterized protein n=1 Tax=Candidatus Methanophaga sp. ANME-1 ERB7 TaxID=2759913 RepID=A0A7G9Z8I1_9EURY|nr:hypothetical protein CBNJMBCK_00008 [Methanosarcinales archaeon ANME-1 ERB7]
MMDGYQVNTAGDRLKQADTCSFTAFLSVSNVLTKEKVMPRFCWLNA